MKFTVEQFQPSQSHKWNDFVDNSNEGTLFHHLDFLAYHGKKFCKNEHHLIIHKGQAVHAVMPLAIFDEDGRRIARSPYGARYGGPVFSKPQNYHDSHGVVEAILEYLESQGVDELTLTLPTSVCYRRYSETLRLVLLERGFQCINRDISSVVCLDKDNPASKEMISRVRNTARKARKARAMGVDVVCHAPIADFWQVLEMTFEKHNSKPTHTLAEFQQLHERNPERVYVEVATLDGIPVAGVGYFVINQNVKSSFYLCQNPQKQQAQGLSLLIYEALERAQKEGFRWFDFGTSSAQMQGRPNIFRFKESFGAIGVFRETYVWRQPR